jgi:CRISPR-associated endonuclease/helicase Cas3
MREYLEFCIVFSALLQADRGSFFAWHSQNFDLSLNTRGLVRSGLLSELRREFQQKVFSSNEFTDQLMVLEAPTGIGKTKILLDLVKRLTSSGTHERIFYFSPLLALTDDFESKLYDASAPDNAVIQRQDMGSILAYNHVYAGSLEKKHILDRSEADEEAPDFFKTEEYFDTESFNWKFIVTTTQRLLYIIYSNATMDKMKLLSFKNSILILDEVQTIPKFLLTSFMNLLKLIAERLNSKIILVSATVPNQIKNTACSIHCPIETKEAYLRRTTKRIDFQDHFDIKKEAATFKNNERILIISNTRRKALTLYNSITEVVDDVQYISAGVRKKTRREMIGALRGKKPSIIVSTQVMEAGVDVSFSKLYREVGPLDSVVQAMGRLNREAESPGHPTMVVFKLDSDWRPYNELEFCESLPILMAVQTSDELYSRLPEYYDRIDEKNQLNKRLVSELEHLMKHLEFDEVWNFVWRNALSEDSRGSVLIPSLDEWDDVREYYSAKGVRPRKGSYSRYADLMAELPRTPKELQITHLFEQDLMEKGILLPKKDCISRIYDEKTGLDGLLKQP